MRRKIMSVLTAFVLMLVCIPFAPSITAFADDDYPAKYKNAALDSLVDEWRYYNRECTSFVAWRLNSRNGVNFHNMYGGVNFGNANTWGAAARKIGITVDMNPAVGSVYWEDAGCHVAWVEAVNGNNVTIEEYNWAIGNGQTDGLYHRRTVPKTNASGYIHIKDINVQPERGTPMTQAEAAGQTIPDGDYWIFSALNAWYYLDIPGTEKMTSNVDLAMWMDPADSKGVHPDPSDADIWTFKYMGTGFYKITQKGTNMCLAVKGDSTLKGTTIQLAKNDDSYSQRWSVVRTDTGYKLRSMANGYYVDIDHSLVESGTHLYMWSGSNAKNQSFCLVPGNTNAQPLKDGTYRIKTVLSDKFYVDVAGSTDKYKNGSNIQIWENTSDEYKIKYAGKGWYKIYEKTSGLALTVNAGDDYTKNAANIEMNEDGILRKQLWMFIPTEDGHYNIISKLSGYYMDLENSKCENGNNISQNKSSGSKAQKWDFVPVTTTTKKTTTTTKKTTTTTKATTTTKKTTTTTKATTTTSKTTTKTTTAKPVTTTTAPALSVGIKEVTLYEGDQFTLKPNQSGLTFKSNKTDVAIVSKSGVITAVSAGDAIITVINADSDAVTVKVKVVSTIHGDTNKDGTVTVADLTMLQKWLIAASKDITDTTNADMNGDGRLDAFDLVLLRKSVISK